MAVTINDLFAKASNGTVPVATTLSAQKTSGASSMSLASATGWPIDTPIHCLLYTLMADGKTVTPGSVTVWKGILSSTTVGTLTLRGGSDATYPSGSQVILAPTDSWADDLITGILVGHNQDGSHVANLPLTTPKITTGIKDANANTMWGFSATASAVNYLRNTNAATGNAPKLSADGTDSNVGMDFQAKGTGKVRFLDGNGNPVIVADAAVASAVNYVKATNAATGGAPILAPDGTDTNASIYARGKGTGFFLPQLPFFSTSLSGTSAGGESVVGLLSLPAFPVAVRVILMGYDTPFLGTGGPTQTFACAIRRGNSTAGTQLAAVEADHVSQAGISDTHGITVFTFDNIAANTAQAYVFTQNTSITITSGGQFQAFVFAQ